jgi:5-methylcytosine-specific restriction protein A
MAHLKPCLNTGCGVLHRNRSRCDSCQAKYDQQTQADRGSSTTRGYGSDWRKIRAKVLAAHQKAWPGICPGWQREPHLSDDLTVDHVKPKSKGGTDELENLQVLCRPCNSAKHNR